MYIYNTFFTEKNKWKDKITFFFFFLSTVWLQSDGLTTSFSQTNMYWRRRKHMFVQEYEDTLL